jgi:nucleolar protein 58
MCRKRVGSNVPYRLKLKHFQKFDSATTALEEVAAVIEGKVTSRLANLLNSIKDEKKVSLAVADPKLGMIPRPFSSAASPML